MDKEKQIEEMAECMTEGVRPWAEDAEALYNAGYRKASEVIDEVFEQIRKKAFPHYYGGIPVITRADIDGIEEELKKKYTEGIK